MRYPIDNLEKWYVASGFGENRGTYLHEGEDLNLKTGGDTDLGQPLFAISAGEVTSVHRHLTGFGNHLHIRHGGEWGTVYCHYAHCQDIFVKLGDIVKEGDKVATLGKSGTDYAHLHWAVKLQPTGIDAVAKTKDDLKQWTAPIEFVTKWREKQEADITNQLTEKLLWYEKEYPLEQERLTACRSDREKLVNDNKTLTHQLEESDNQLVTLIRTLSNELGTTQNEASVVAGVRTLKQKCSDTQKALQTTQSSIDLFIAEASKGSDVPLTSLEAVLERYKLLSSGDIAPIEPIKPLIQQIIDYLTSIFKKRG